MRFGRKSETGHCSKDAIEKAEQMGQEIAKRGLVLVTGATIGIPYWAGLTRARREAGGRLSGSFTGKTFLVRLTLKLLHLPIDYHDLIIYTGFDYAGRNFLLMPSGAKDAIDHHLRTDGQFERIHIGFEDRKPNGVPRRFGRRWI